MIILYNLNYAWYNATSYTVRNATNKLVDPFSKVTAIVASNFRILTESSFTYM